MKMRRVVADMRAMYLLWMLSSWCCSVCVASLDEARLIDHLLKKKVDSLKEADKIVRPVINDSLSLEVEFALGVAQLADFSEERQTLDVLIWENMRWTDEFLSWNPEDFAGLKVTLIPVDRMWVPDVIPYRVMEFSSPQVAPYMAMVTYDGHVTFVPQRVYSIPCAVDVLHFPLDMHTCNLTYGSWSYSEDALNLTFYEGTTGIISEQFIPNQKWNLVNLTIQRKEVTFACCSGKYIMFEYSITIQRQVAFFAFVLILPAVMLSVLTLVAFCLPPDCAEKVGIGLSIFLSYFVLLVILVESSPAVGTTVPLLGQFFSLSLVLIALSVFCSAFVYNIKDKERKGRPFPAKRLKLLVRLASWLMVDTSQVHQVADDPKGNLYRVNTTCENGAHAPPDIKSTAYKGLPQSDSASFQKPSAGEHHVVHDDAVGWMLLATIFDRIFFIIYLLINIIAGIFIFCVEDKR